MKESKIASQQSIYNGFIQVDKLSLTLEDNNEEVERVIVRQKNGVGILLYCVEEDYVVLVKQFRVPLLSRGENPFLIEIPAGVVNGEEDIEESVCREVREETGYKINNPMFLMAFYTSPGVSTEKLKLFYAEINKADKIYKGGGLEEEHEEIEIMNVSLTNCVKMIETGELNDAKSIIAIQWLWNKLHGKSTK